MHAGCVIVVRQLLIMGLTKIVAVLYIAAITITIVAFTMLIRVMDINEGKWADIAGMSSRDQSELKNGNDKGEWYFMLTMFRI